MGQNFISNGFSFIIISINSFIKSESTNAFQAIEKFFTSCTVSQYGYRGLIFFDLPILYDLYPKLL
jgi:hypothetical protein